MLRQFSEEATEVARLEEAVEILEDLLFDAGGTEDDEPSVDDEVEESPLAIAYNAVYAQYEDADRELEGKLIEWLAEDPEHWGIYRVTILDQWQAGTGLLRPGAPRWLRVLDTNATLAHYQHDQYGRQRVVDLGTLGVVDG